MNKMRNLWAKGLRYFVCVCKSGGGFAGAWTEKWRNGVCLLWVVWQIFVSFVFFFVPRGKLKEKKRKKIYENQEENKQRILRVKKERRTKQDEMDI